MNENENDNNNIQKNIEKCEMQNNIMKFDTERENLDAFINNLRKQAEGLKISQNSNSNDIKINKLKFSENTENYSNSKYLSSVDFKNNLSKSSNSNDIFVKTDINKSENINKNNNDYNKNNIYTIEEEIATYSLEENNSNQNNNLYDKMKGSDINIKSKYNSCRNLKTDNKKVMIKTFNFDINNENLSQDIDYNNDINIKINTS